MVITNDSSHVVLYKLMLVYVRITLLNLCIYLYYCNHDYSLLFLYIKALS